MAAITGEVHTVPVAAPYRVELAQVPLAGSVAVAGFIGATTFVPPEGYFRVHVAPPQVEFHASAAGDEVLVSYEGTGEYVAPAEPPPTVLERQADFDAASPSADVSTDALPDAVVLAVTTAYAADPDGRAWRARADGERVLLAGAEGDEWGTEEVLFSFSGAAIRWLSLAYEGSARPVVAAERATGMGGASELWIYHFDPTIPGFTFQGFGAGRCPAAVLDDIDPTDGDVQVFYVGADGVVAHRQQRNRYAAASATPLALGEAGTLLRAIRAEGDRLSLFAATRDALTGRWALERLDSAPFPSRHSEAMDFTAHPLAATLMEVPVPGPERMEFSAAPLAATLRLAVFTNEGAEQMQFSAAPTGGTLRAVVFTYPATEEVTFSAAPTGGVMNLVVLLYAPEAEALQFTATPIGGTLDVV